MNRSDTIGKLAEALSKAQGAIKGAVKDSENPFFKSKYADLASVWDACREALSLNGLAVIQLTDNAVGQIIVETVLTHSSGEWISSPLAMKPVKDDPQGIGSCISYARRYALAAMVGVYQEDDDANSASRGPESTLKPPQRKEPPLPPAESRPPLSERGTLPLNPPTIAHEHLLKELAEWCEGDMDAMGQELVELTAFTAKDGKKVAGKQRVSELSESAAKVALGRLRKQVEDYANTHA